MRAYDMVRMDLGGMWHATTHDCRHDHRTREGAEACAKRHIFVRCESGWTNDRCTYPLGHDGPHSNE